MLAVDTATENCSAALLVEGRLIARERVLPRGHAEHILPMIGELLAEAGMTLASLTAIAFGRGPGSFTGVRLAASVTQGIAFAAGLGVVPVSDLCAVAQRLLSIEHRTARVLVCNDARMGEVYWGCFERGAGGLAAARGPEHVGAPERVSLPPGWAEDKSAGGLQGAGTGFIAYPRLGALVGVAPGPALYPRAVEIARLAAPEVAAGRLLPPEQALPVYLRDEVAQTRGHGH